MSVDNAIIRFLIEFVKSEKNSKTRKWVAYTCIPALLIIISIVEFFPFGKNLSMEEKQKALVTINLINMPGMSGEDYYVHRKLETGITPKDYLDFANFRLDKIRTALDNVDADLMAVNADPFAGNLFHLFKSDKADESRLLFDLMDNYFINIVEEVDTKKNRYSILLTAAISNDKIIDSAIAFFRDEDPCVHNFFQKIVDRLQTEAQVTFSFDELTQAITTSCPHAKALVKLLSHGCGDAGSCNNLYFSKGAYKLNSYSLSFLNSFGNMILEMLSKKRFSRLNIKLEGSADSTHLLNPIPIEEGCTIATPGTWLDGSSGTTIFSIRSNEELSFARAGSCWKFLQQKLAGTEIQFSFTGKGVSTSGITLGDNRTVRIIINRS